MATKLLYASNPNVRSYDPTSPAGGVPFDSRFLTCATCYASYASFLSGGNYTTIFGTPYQVVPGSFVVPRNNSVTSYGVSFSADYRLSDDLSLKSITAYRSAHGGYGADVDGSPLDITSQYYALSHEQVTQELRLSGKAGTLLDYTVGGFYYHANDRQAYRVVIPTDLYDFLANDPVTNETRSGFAHIELHALPGLDIVAGLRYTRQDKTYSFSRLNADGTAISGAPLSTNFLLAGLSGLSSPFSGSHLDYRAGVDYRFSRQLMTYAQVSTGFKGGGVNPEPFVPDQAKPFRPETLTSYEAGWKADLAGDAVRLNGAVFFNDYRDIQMTLYACTDSASLACNETANAGSAHIRGAELEASLIPIRGLVIHAAGSYLDFAYTQVNPATNVTPGMVAPFNNKWQASAAVEYTASLGGAGILTSAVDWSWHSSFYFNAVNAPTNLVRGNSLVNAHLSYEPNDSHWTVSAGVTNLLNKFYYTGMNDDVSVFSVLTGMVGPPREYSVSVRRTF